MAYYSYLNMGVAYDNESNFFNALQAYETAISKEHCLLKGLNNIGVTMTQLGMQREALNKLNRSISYVENGRTERDKQAWKDYANRAKLLRMLGKYEEMQKDIQKSFQLKPDFVNCWIQIGKFNLQTGEIQKSEEAFNRAVSSEPSKPYVWIERGKFFQITQRYDQAISDFNKASLLSTNKKSIFPLLAHAYLLCGNIEKAEECLNKMETNMQLNEVGFQYGIVLFVDKVKGYGFILGKTFLNDYDSIYFKFSDCKTIPLKGDRVKFEPHYQKHKNLLTTTAKQIAADIRIVDQSFRKTKIHHAIISVRQNAFKSSNDCKYIEAFYPNRTILPFSLVEGKLDTEINSQLNRIGYSFVELVITITDSNLPELDFIKPIKFPNTYSNKIVSKRRSSRSYSSSSYSGRTCYVCGMDEWCGTDGCPWDPT